MALMRKFRYWLVIFGALALLSYTIISFIPQEAEGRPGGGGGFRSGRSGGGGSRGGGGSSGSGSSYQRGRGGGVYVVPSGGGGSFGVTLAIIVAVMVGFYLYSKMTSGDERVSSAPLPDDLFRQKQEANDRIRKMFRSVDPNFSTPLFYDFIQLLYTQWHHRRTKPEFMHLSPYAKEDVLAFWFKQDKVPIDVREIVIGSIDIMNVMQTGSEQILVVEIDANYTEHSAGRNLRVRSLERWTMRRKMGVLPPPPDKLRSLSCPNCGSSLETDTKGACRHCGSVVQPGTQQWELSYRHEIERHTSKGEQIGNYVAETGTNDPTVIDPRLHQSIAEFSYRNAFGDFNLYWKNFSDNIVQPIYYALNEAWTGLNWEKARPLITDHLFQTYYYWIEFYKRENVKPVMRNARLLNAVLVKVECDKFYDSITVRIFATGYDYIEDKNGKVISGSSRKERKYSEYWTFIRRAGVEKPESSFDPNSCPSCGAPIKMGQSGVCDYCGSKVTQGDFGWVLSRITQDEVYLG